MKEDMWVIEYRQPYNDGEYVMYFKQFGLWGLREYSKKADARLFDTKKEAQCFLKQTLESPRGHKVVKA